MPKLQEKHTYRFEVCPCCDDKSFRTFYANQTPTALTTWQTFFYGSADYIPTVIECQYCGYKFIDKLPENYMKFYEAHETTDYKKMSDTRRRYFKSVKSMFLKKTEIKRPSKILDIACGQGDWLSVWPEAHQLFGSEKSPEHLKSLKGKGITAIEGNIEDHGTFDLISMFDFLEHVEDPKAFLQTIKPLMNEGCSNIIGVPNMDKIAAKILRQKYYLYCPMHFSYFSKKGLKQLLENTFPNCDIFVENSPGMSADINAILKWMFPKIKLPEHLNFHVPIPYSASLIAIVKS